MPLIEAFDLSCGHAVPVLRGIDIAVEAGETVALLGPNGSGKSTLLKTLAGLLSPLAGEIRLQSEDIWGIKSREMAQKISHRAPLTHEQAEAVVARFGDSMGLTPQQRADMVARLQKVD